jgi:hypothetical protein
VVLTYKIFGPEFGSKLTFYEDHFCQNVIFKDGSEAYVEKLETYIDFDYICVLLNMAPKEKVTATVTDSLKNFFLH